MTPIKKYTLHILAIRGIREDTFDIALENNAVIVCTERYNENLAVLPVDHVLQIPFPDYEDYHLQGAFNRIDARIIKNFIHSLPDTVTDMYICCSKGGSRSPAVAAALLRASGRSDMDVWKNPFYVPNTLVYFRLCKELGVKTTTLSVFFRVLINKHAYRKAQKNKGSTPYERWQILD